jgi:hypothetical protein
MISAYIFAEQRGLKIVPAKQLQVFRVGAIALVGSVSIFWYKGAQRSVGNKTVS